MIYLAVGPDLFHDLSWRCGILSRGKIEQKRIAMARHNEFGKKGEELAAAWLMHKGYEVLCRNWRHGRSEVDIIARYEGLLHFIEVKSARSREYGHPEEKVGRKKISRLMGAALAYRHEFPGYGRAQLDVLSVTILNGADPEFFLITDVSL
jgi:putative endonuclease